MRRSRNITIEQVESAAAQRIRSYFRELGGSLLSEEDALGASLHGEAVLLEHTDLPLSKCRDMALDMAFEIKPEFDHREVTA